MYMYRCIDTQYDTDTEDKPKKEQHKIQTQNNNQNTKQPSKTEQTKGSERHRWYVSEEEH
jgi:hypothetical protein